MSDEIRQTVTTEGRTLHLRRFGQGPAVVLLHESPRSSAVLLPLARRLARDFTVFALDTPGFGQSDPLPIARPTIQDFADAIVASLRTLGLTRAPVYGTHTGACIALSIARRHPDFASGVVLDGYPVFTPQQSDEYAAQYMAFFEPSWDGAHVSRLWSRVRDQYTFFPWYALGREGRLAFDPPPPEWQTGVVRDLVTAGSTYAKGYEAAFRMDGLAELEGLSVPACFMCRSDDLLFTHLDRLPPLPATASILRLGPDRAVLADEVAAAFSRMAGDAAPAPRFGIDGTPNGALRALSDGVLAKVYDTGAREAAPLVLIHDLPGSGHDWDALAWREARRRRVISLLLPGAGVSPALPGTEAHDPDAVVAALAAALSAHALGSVDLGGRGAGALVALRLADRLGGSAGRVLLVEPPAAGVGAPPEDVVPTPVWHGGHLTAAWYECRDRMLYRPWWRRHHAHARTFGPGVDVASVHAAFRGRILSEGVDVALAAELQADADGLARRDLGRCAVVLRRGDPDNAVQRESLTAAGASVSVAAYDDVPEAGVIALRG